MLKNIFVVYNNLENRISIMDFFRDNILQIQLENKLQ